MSHPNKTLAGWQKISRQPGGKWLFSRMVCRKAPFFASIKPHFEALRPGYCEVSIRKRHSVLNHIGTVHAIAMCNMAEISGGTMMEATVPPSHRWIPKGMRVEYLKKAETDLRAVAELSSSPDFGDARELEVPVTVMDAAGETVFRAYITMWISPKPKKAT